MSYEIARSQFPNAFIQAATFENFTSILAANVDKLPVVTKEMGDVWIQGGGSDPRKTAEMRAMFRMRALCLKQGTRTNKCTEYDNNKENLVFAVLSHQNSILSAFCGVAKCSCYHVLHVL